MSARSWNRLAALLVTAAVLLIAKTLADAIAQEPVPPACVTIRAAGDSGLYVNLANDVTPQTIAHVREAVRAGQPRILHWKPEESAANRAASLRGVPTWNSLTAERKAQIDPDGVALAHDRDEYPPAASDEGGAGADVAYVRASDNRSSGQRMGAVMSPYCSGQAFIVEP